MSGTYKSGRPSGVVASVHVCIGSDRRTCRESEVRQISDLQAEVFSVGFGVGPIDSLLLGAFKVQYMYRLWMCCSSAFVDRASICNIMKCFL